MSSPIIQATISACVLTATSNIAAQWITAYRNNAPYTIDWIPVLQFMLFTALNSPPNFLWQQFLESSFPSHTLAPTSQAIAAAATNNEPLLDKSASAHTIVASRLSIRNTVIKFVLDQSVGAALNNLAFCLAMGAFQGLRYRAALVKARGDFWPLMRAGWRLWPLVSALNFSVVRSVQGRALVGSVAGMGWGVYLSLVAGEGRR